MSKIGQQPINIPSEVTVTLEPKLVTIKGPKGTLTQAIDSRIKVEQNGNELLVTRVDDTKPAKSLHGLIRSLLANMVAGVTAGFSKRLELVGTGFRAIKDGSKLTLSLGFSHPVEIIPPAGVNLDVEGNNKIIVSGIDKQQVGLVAAKIRSLKKPEPYKGKGIRFEGEVVRRKAGKAAKVGTAS